VGFLVKVHVASYKRLGGLLKELPDLGEASSMRGVSQVARA
jgi:hypothetical protein